MVASEAMQTDQSEDFWEYVDRLVAGSRVVIDRPRGSKHPRWADLEYPLDYGHLADSQSSDGSEIDVWIGSLAPGTPGGVLISVDLFKHDAEFDILLGCTQQEQQTILTFANSGSMRAQIIPRHPDMLHLFQERRSVRRFRGESFPADLLAQVLKAATLAPSAHNTQPWRFAVLQARQSKEDLAQAMGADFLRDLVADGFDLPDAQRQVARSRQRILDAPVAILLCLDRSVEDIYPDPPRQQASHLMMAQSVAIAGGYLLLAAQAVGLGGVWMCAPLFATAAVRQALHLPLDWEPQGLILLGHPAQVPERRPRLSVDDVTRFY